MEYNWARTKMKKSIYLMAFICFILFVGCKKSENGTDSKEDLSYVIRTYYRYESNSHIYKYTWTYDGLKETGYKSYVDGQLTTERKNYLYNGLNASWDEYSYRDSVTYREHCECEYLDETFRRVKYEKTQYYDQDSQITNIYETYYEYDGKKMISYKTYSNGVLTGENHYSYDGLRCTYKTWEYYSGNVIRQERDYEIVYLDDSYLREKTRLLTRKRYNTDGELQFSNTFFTVNEYDGMKPIGQQFYQDGKLGGMGRDYHYDGLTCYYFYDTYRDGEVYSTSLYEVEYLE